jgi:hypothetical protein
VFHRVSGVFHRVSGVFHRVSGVFPACLLGFFGFLPAENAENAEKDL